MESEGDWNLYEKIIKINRNFNNHLRKTQKLQKAQKPQKTTVQNKGDLSKIVLKQKDIIQKQKEKILKQEQEIKDLREIAKKSLKYIEGVKKLIDNKILKEIN